MVSFVPILTFLDFWANSCNQLPSLLMFPLFHPNRASMDIIHCPKHARENWQLYTSARKFKPSSDPLSISRSSFWVRLEIPSESKHAREDSCPCNDWRIIRRKSWWSTLDIKMLRNRQCTNKRLSKMLINTCQGTANLSASCLPFDEISARELEKW